VSVVFILVILFCARSAHHDSSLCAAAQSSAAITEGWNLSPPHGKLIPPGRVSSEIPKIPCAFDSARLHEGEADGVRQRIAQHVRALRDGLLGLPDRLASTLAAETDQRKVHVLLKTELTRELEALSHALGDG
jgi:hypothetical protein